MPGTCGVVGRERKIQAPTGIGSFCSLEHPCTLDMIHQYFSFYRTRLFVVHDARATETPEATEDMSRNELVALSLRNLRRIAAVLCFRLPALLQSRHSLLSSRHPDRSELDPPVESALRPVAKPPSSRRHSQS